MTSAKLTPAQLRRVRNAIKTVPYARLLGIQLDNVAPGTAQLSMRVKKEHTQNHGVVHGGAVASLIDSATAFAIITLLDANQRVTTVDLTISYLRAVRSGKMVCNAEVIRAGRRLIVVSAKVQDVAGNLTATALSTYITVAPGS